MLCTTRAVILVLFTVLRFSGIACEEQANERKCYTKTDYDEKLSKTLKRLEKKVNNFDLVLEKIESTYGDSEASRNLKLENKLRTTAEKFNSKLTDLVSVQNQASRDFISYANSTGKD